MTGLEPHIFRSRRFNAYNLEYPAEDASAPGRFGRGAYARRRAAILDAGLLDERFLCTAKIWTGRSASRMRGWEVWYNGAVEIAHVKEAASSQSANRASTL